jgi:Cu(I)/Ag(I) efflux system membrane fusion protein
MKKINLKRTFALLAVIFITTAFLTTGCSKQETKTTTADTTKKNVTQEQPKQETTTADNQTEKNNTAAKEEKTETTKDNASVQHATINIPTAQCDVCQGKIETALKKVAGVKNYDIDIDGKVVNVNFDKSVTNLGKIENAITAVGYDANSKKADPDAYSKLDDCCKLPQDRKKNKSN